MRARAAFLVLALVASCAPFIYQVRAQSTIPPVQCALTSSVTTCSLPLLLSYQAGQSFGCTIDSGGTWSGQLDFLVVGLETPAAASGFQPNTNMGGVINTTTNGIWQLSVNNAAQLQVIVDTPGSFTGTANVGIRCAPASFQNSTTGQVGRNVTIVKPTDGSGYVNVDCQTGCSASATIPPETSTSSPLPVATSLPVIGQMYFWNGTGWIAVSATTPLPVTTPAPVGTIGVVQQAAPLATTPVSCTFAGCLVTIPTPTSNVAVFPGATIGVTTPVPFQSSSPYPNGQTGIQGFGQNAGGPISPIICTHRASISLVTTQATETLLVASASGKIIYVCGIVGSGQGTSGTWGLETSATNVCGTPTSIFSLPPSPSAFLTAGNGVGLITVTGSGVALCAFNVTTSPTNTSLSIMYEQFLHELTPEQLSDYCSVPKRCLLYGLFRRLNARLDGAMRP